MVDGTSDTNANGAGKPEQQSSSVSNDDGWNLRGNPSGLETADPASAGVSGGTPASGTGKRGRPPGGKNKTSGGTTKKTTTDLAGLEKLFFSIHAMGSTFLNVKELALDPKEAALLAKAASDVAAHYNIDVDPKTQAWIALGVAMAGVYGPRIASIVIRKKSKREEISQPEKDNVVDFSKIISPSAGASMPFNGFPPQ